MKGRKEKVTVNEFFKNEALDKRKEAFEKMFINIIKKFNTNANK